MNIATPDAYNVLARAISTIASAQGRKRTRLEGKGLEASTNPCYGKAVSLSLCVCVQLVPFRCCLALIIDF